MAIEVYESDERHCNGCNAKDVKTIEIHNQNGSTTRIERLCYACKEELRMKLIVPLPTESMAVVAKLDEMKNQLLKLKSGKVVSIGSLPYKHMFNAANIHIERLTNQFERLKAKPPITISKGD